MTISEKFSDFEAEIAEVRGLLPRFNRKDQQKAKLRVGEVMAQLKVKVAHGDWAPLCKELGVSTRTAINYISFYERGGKPKPAASEPFDLKAAEKKLYDQVKKHLAKWPPRHLQRAGLVLKGFSVQIEFQADGGGFVEELAAKDPEAVLAMWRTGGARVELAEEEPEQPQAEPAIAEPLVLESPEEEKEGDVPAPLVPIVRRRLRKYHLTIGRLEVPVDEAQLENAIAAARVGDGDEGEATA
jgi:hypothetical protein